MVNDDFAYVLVFLAIAASGVGRILGLGAYVENYEVGGEGLTERFSVFKSVYG